MPNIRGRITKNAEVKAIGSGKEVVNFSVAVNEKYKARDGQDKERVAFFNCAYWFDTDIAKHLTKGRTVDMSGWIAAEAYMKGNDPQAKLVMHVQSVKFPFESKKKAGVQTAIPAEASDDLPF